MRRSALPIGLLVLIAVGGVVVLVTRPDAVLGATKSWQGLALMGGTGVVALAVLLLVRRFAHSWAWGLVAASVPFAVAGWLFVAPAYRTKTLHEALPMAGAAPVTAPAASATTGAVAAPPTAPVRISSGRLRGIGHHATGGAAVYRVADGSYVVRFEQADIQNAPDPYVYLVPRRGATRPDGGTRLGRLRATRGEFNQPAPRDFDYAREFTVLVWCKKFATPIASAPQST
jgi:hypothetical protein